jgi:ribosomal protein S26
MNTIILPCSYKSEFQDETYGKGRRLHNVSQKGKERKAYCTICSPRQPKTKVTTQLNPMIGMVIADKMDPARVYKTY